MDLLILFEEVKSQETYGSCKEPLSSERGTIEIRDGRIKSFVLVEGANGPDMTLSQLVPKVTDGVV